MMQLSEAAAIVHGTLIGRDQRFSGVTIDSRNLIKGDLFVALAGERQDGHDYVGPALNGGAAGAMVEKITDVAISQLKVTDTTRALGQLAKHWRAQFSIPVIGITGSNGKTTVTAMVREILCQSHQPLFPEKSFNNQWGVPLTLLKLGDHSHAVIEMGMNHPGEINYLAQITAPTIALINNAAAAHLEGLGDVEQVAIAKGEIIDSLSMRGVVILNAEDAYFDFWRRQADSRKVVSFGIDATADFFATDVTLSGTRSRFELHAGKQRRSITLPLPGRHNVMNALAAAAASYTAGATVDDIVSGLESMTAVGGRLQSFVTAAGAMLIDDSFNANPASIKAAIDVLAASEGKRILVLGAMAELGADRYALHRQVGEDAAAAQIDRLLYLDDDAKPETAGYGEGYGSNAERFSEVAGLVEAIAADDRAGSTILVKGSKSSRMDRVVKALMKAAANTQSKNKEAQC